MDHSGCPHGTGQRPRTRVQNPVYLLPNTWLGLISFVKKLTIIYPQQTKPTIEREIREIRRKTNLNQSV
jgi:hypothetical protein